MIKKENLQKKVDSFPFWYHRIELPFGIVTPGWSPINKEAYLVPGDLTGKRILDVGAWDGFWTFEALKRGAQQVVAIDDFSDFMGSDPSIRKAWETFDLCKEAFGYSDEQCQRIDMSVYDVSKEQLGLFDIVFFFGTFYHLRHPLLALDKLAPLCTGEIYVESAVLDHYSPYNGGLGCGFKDGQILMEFYPEKQYGSNITNWWVPTLDCLGLLVKSSGFPNVEVWELTKTPPGLPFCRGFVRGKK